MKIIWATACKMHGNHLNSKSQINLPNPQHTYTDAATPTHMHTHRCTQTRAIEQL